MSRDIVKYDDDESVFMDRSIRPITCSFWAICGVLSRLVTAQSHVHKQIPHNAKWNQLLYPVILHHVMHTQCCFWFVIGALNAA